MEDAPTCGRDGKKRNAAILDSAVAHSTSPLDRNSLHTVRLVIGDPSPLKLSERWFPTPDLPHTASTVEWQGMGGRVFATTVFHTILAFTAGVIVSASYFFGTVLPRRLKGRGLGGYEVGGAGGMGNAWGLPAKDGSLKRTD